MTSLLSFTDRGIWCEQADMYIETLAERQRQPIARARRSAPGASAGTSAHPIAKRLMHAHGEQPGHEYAAVRTGGHVDGVRFSLHPAGHIPAAPGARGAPG